MAESIRLPDDQLIALAAAILMTRANPPIADEVAVKAAKRLLQMARDAVGGDATTGGMQVDF